MIVLDRVTAFAIGNGKPRKVLSSVSVALPANRRIAVLGTSSDDAKTLINIIAGKTLPVSGSVIRKARVSYPVGDVTGFDIDMTVRSNVAYVARLYGADVESTVAFVKRSSRLGPAFERKFRNLGRQERTMLGQILTYSIPFDLYLLNQDFTALRNPPPNVTALLDARIAQSAGIIAAVGVPKFGRERCEMGLVIHMGQLFAFADFEEALYTLNQLKKEKSAAR